MLFGHERAYRKLTLQDLIDDDHEIALRQGGIQAMPGTDAAGRGLVFYDRTKWNARRSHRASMVSHVCCATKLHTYILLLLLPLMFIHYPIWYSISTVSNSLVYPSISSRNESFGTTEWTCNADIQLVTI